MVKSKQVCCCGAKVWALVIGWLETIFSGLGILTYSLALVILNIAQSEHSSNEVDAVLHMYALKEDQNKLREHFNDGLKATRKEFVNRLPFPLVGLIVVYLIISVINMVFGIVLITGVHQEKAGRLKAYIVWQAGLLFIYAIIAVILMELLSFVSALPVMIGFLVSLFFMCVVNVHRKELLTRSPVPVPVSVPVSAA